MSTIRTLLFAVFGVNYAMRLQSAKANIRMPEYIRKV